MNLETPFAVRLEAARRMIARGTVCLPRHEYDQAEAAARDSYRVARDTAQLLRFVQPDRGWFERTQSSMAVEQRVYMLAALLDCVRATCPHLRREGPQPAFAQLPLRRLVCSRCVQTLRKPPPEDADRCDVCGEHGIQWFVPFLVDSGPLLIGGDVCSACARVLGFEDAEQVA